MKTQQSQLNIILIFAAAVTALFVAGCAEVGSGNTTSLLTAAGFRAHTPADANATANLRCPAALQSRAGHHKRTRFLRV